jgi:hypothetical protein
VKVEMILPIVLAVIDLGAAGVYGYKGDWARVAYWVSAACITSSTLAMK